MSLKTDRLLFCGLLILAFFCASVFADEENSKKVKINDDPESAKVTYKKTVIGSDLEDIIWCGEARESVLVSTQGGVVYYSDNGGLDWKRLKEAFVKAGQKVSDDEDVGVVSSLVQSQADPQLVFFLGSEGVNWYTENCGKTIKALEAGRAIKRFEFHPTKREWILASSFHECDEESKKPCKSSQELYISQDLGKTWTFLTDYIIQFAWGVQDKEFLSTIPEQRIIVTKDLRTSKSQKLGGWAEQVQMVYSDDLFKTKKIALKSGQKFLITNTFLFAVKVEDEDAQDVSLFVSDPKIKSYKFQKIELPTKDKLYERSYVILDTSEGQVFLHINHGGVDSKYGDVYISDSTGTRYSLSLKNNVRSNEMSDFESVMGLEGIFFANVYDPKLVRKIKDEMDSGADVPTEKGRKKGKGKESGTKPVSKRLQELDEFKKTLMTFDKGGMWEPIPAPKYDALGQQIECEDTPCSLHLHSLSNRKYGPFYSTDNSLGLLLATGNVGKYLSNKEDEINTYLSRDGGLNWYEIIQGSHIYEIGDHGSIIIVANDQQATHQIYYTWNEGHSWTALKISEVPIEIENIITEPSNTAQKFILYGRTTTTSNETKGVIKSRKGVLIGIDFSTLHERECRLADRPDDEQSDYETWTPHAYLSDSCLMGHQLTYVRRKRMAECYNLQEFEKLYSFKNCTCTEEDWECDIGYERKDGTGACTLPQGEEPSYKPPEECDGYWSISSGYRKVAGNTCVGGIDHSSIKLACPSKVFTKQNATFLLGFALAGLVFWVFMKKGDKFAGLLKGSTTNKHLNRNDFKPIGQDEGAEIQFDDKEDFSEKLRFEDDGKSVPMQTRNEGGTTGKRMAQRGGLETASKHIPSVHKPGTGSDEEDDVGGFDPRT